MGEGSHRHRITVTPRRAKDDPHASVEQLSVPVITANRQFLLGQPRSAGRYQTIFRKRPQYRPDASRAVGIFQL
jgi:hypothetical protein